MRPTGALRGLKRLSDPRVRELLRHLERAVRASATRRRELGHLLAAARWLLDRKGDAIRFGEVDKSKESAHFDEVKEEIVLDEAMRRHPVELGAAVLCHELQHAYDEMAGRPYTFEAEIRSFRAESVFLSWFPPARVAAKVKDANGWHWFGFIYRKRMEFLKGEAELEGSTLFDFVKSYLGEAKFDGLQSVEKTLLDVRQSIRLKERERDETLRQLKKRPLGAAEKRALKAQAEILDADLDSGARIASNLRRELELVRKGNPLALP